MAYTLGVAKVRIAKQIGDGMGKFVGWLVMAASGGAAYGFATIVWPNLPRALPFTWLIGLPIWFLLVKFLLSKIESLRPAVAWLFPYDSWLS